MRINNDTAKYSCSNLLIVIKQMIRLVFRVLVWLIVSVVQKLTFHYSNKKRNGVQRFFNRAILHQSIFTTVLFKVNK